MVWKCKCDCENTHYAKTASLRNGRVQSCGCLQKEQASRSNIEKGLITKAQNSLGHYCGTIVEHLSKDKYSNNTTGVKGVWFDKSRNKYCAEIFLKGKKYHLGRYEKLEDAAKARKRAEEELFHPIIEEYERLSKD